ncbi:MAG: alpha-galactosidase [Clostridia bacterium]|nr:alpha-galactosidase [Clostridia bacterium]
MKYRYFDTETVLTFTVMPPLYRPYYNGWGSNVYATYDPFCQDPFTINASSTSGSPVILACHKFFGFMNQVGGSFSYDGAYRLTVTCPAGQGLWVNEDCEPFSEWLAYNEAVLATLPPTQKPEDFWSGLEYCTWVDQKNRAVSLGYSEVQKAITSDFVYEYMRRVDKLKLPRGKLTIDDGWDVRDKAPDGKPCFGNWIVDREKFPNMRGLVSDMKNEGFIPGLWFAPFTVTPNCELIRKYPRLLGKYFPCGAELEESRKLSFLLPDPVLEDYYRSIFEPYIDMGFKKFKMDMSYGNKREMQELMRLMHKVIKSLDSTVEIEGHIGDLFASRYCDTVRINDVNFNIRDWRAVTTEHYKVCRYSSHDKVLNFDHIGTNTPMPREEDYLDHARMLCRMEGGFPCVSLLPDVFRVHAADVLRGELLEWEQERRIRGK